MKTTIVKSLRKKAGSKKRVKRNQKKESDKIFTVDENGIEDEYIYNEYEGAYEKKNAIDTDTLEFDTAEIIY